MKKSIKIGATYKHKKRGGLYEAEALMKLQIGPETLIRILSKKIRLSNLHAEEICKALEKISYVSYSSKDDDEMVFGRPETEFLDGRFELVE